MEHWKTGNMQYCLPKGFYSVIANSLSHFLPLEARIALSCLLPFEGKITPFYFLPLEARIDPSHFLPLEGGGLRWG
jgi:hypothetical protein